MKRVSPEVPASDMIDRPGPLIARPNPARSPGWEAPTPVQALTQMLRDMRLSGGVFLEAEFTAPWCIVAQVGPEDCQAYMPMPRQLVAYHYVLEGICTVAIAGEPLREAVAGQLVVLPRNDRHILASAPGIPPVDALGLIEPQSQDGIARIRHGGGGAASRILCGFLGSDSEYSPLLAALPGTIMLTLDRLRSGPWIEGSMRYAMGELAAAGPDAAGSLTRLAELLLLQALREYVEDLPPAAGGWLRGLADPVTGRVLALIHAHMARAWTVDSLAREAGTSRSVLIERFARLVGIPPMEYLRRRRLERASDRLSHTGRPIGAIAFEVGYGSEAAFSRSFRRAYGCSPGAFRKATANPGRPVQPGERG